MGQARTPRVDSPTARFAVHAMGLVEAINSDDPNALSRFVRSSVSDAGVAASGAEPFVKILQRVREQTGGIDLVDIGPGDNPFLFRVRSRQGRRWARVYMFGDKAQPDLLSEFGFLPLLDPRAEEEAPWILTPMDERRVVQQIDTHVRRGAKYDEFSGVVLVAKDGHLMYRRAVGFAEQSFRVPNRPDTKFHLGSMNKMFTAIGIAQIVERGQLDFRTRLVDVLPDYPNRAASKEIEIHHLLTHTAGLGMLFDRPAYDRSRRYAAHADFFAIFAEAPLLFRPGARHSYSNEGFLVLGAVIERLTNQDYRTYVRENILAPTGMKDTDAYPLDEPTPNRAVGYARFEDDPFAMEPRRANWKFLGMQGNACGGFYSTAPDLLRFAESLRSNRLLGAKLTNDLLSHQGSMPHYGYGFFVEDVAGHVVVGHGGGGPNSGVNADLKIFRDGPYTVVVLSNYDAPVAQDLAKSITELLALQGPPKPAFPGHNQAGLAPNEDGTSFDDTGPKHDPAS